MENELYASPQIDFSKSIDKSAAVRGRTALITGGASGIGLGIATDLCKQGAYVAIVDLNSAGEAIAEDLRKQGHHCCFLNADVTSYEAQLAAFKATISWSPDSTIHIVVPCAGIAGNSIIASLADLGDDDPPPPSTKTLDINIYGVFYTTYLAIHYFKKSALATETVSDRPGLTRPQILFVSSLAGYGDLPLNSNYAVAKFGVRGLFKSVRACKAECGLMRCNILAPSFVRTPFTEAIIPIVLQRNVKVAEVEDAVDGAMRCICDEEVDGRAVCIAPPDGGAPGSANFDLCDDIVNHDAGKVLLAHVQKGTLGDGFADFGRMTKRSREPGSWKGYR